MMSFLETYDNNRNMEQLKNKFLVTYGIDLDTEKVFKHYDIAYENLDLSKHAEIYQKISRIKNTWLTQANSLGDEVAKNNLKLSEKYEQIFKNVDDLRKLTEYLDLLHCCWRLLCFFLLAQWP